MSKVIYKLGAIILLIMGKQNMPNIKEELSAVLSYTLQIAMKLDIDIVKEALKKIDKMH